MLRFKYGLVIRLETVEVKWQNGPINWMKILYRQHPSVNDVRNFLENYFMEKSALFSNTNK